METSIKNTRLIFEGPEYHRLDSHNSCNFSNIRWYAYNSRNYVYNARATDGSKCETFDTAQLPEDIAIPGINLKLEPRVFKPGNFPRGKLN